MKIKPFILKVMVAYLCVSNLPAGAEILLSEEALRHALKEKIDLRLKHQIYDDVHTSVMISGVNGQVFYSRNENIPYSTASAFKIFPAAVALARLGPNYRFNTPVWICGEVNNGTLTGNIYIEGRGDPLITPQDMSAAAGALEAHGISKVSGDVIYDISFFDEEKNVFYPNARNLYTPPCALSVNYGSIDIELDETVKPPVLRLVPDTSYAALDYRIQVIRSKKPGRPEMIYREYPWGDQYRIYGKVTDWDKRYHYLCLGVSRPGLYAATLFKEACVKQGIEVTGSVQKGRVPESAEMLTSVTSGPLLESIKVLNQKSKNIVAEMVNKHLGAVFVSIPGTREKGLSVIRQYCIDEIGLPKNELLFEDVSGLSAKTSLSAKNFTRALNFFYHKTELKNDFLATLDRRSHRAGNHRLDLYVKTGTLSVSGVNSIVGYIMLSKKDVFSFAILANRKSRGTMTYSGTLTHPIIQSIIEAFGEI